VLVLAGGALLAGCSGDQPAPEPTPAASAPAETATTDAAEAGAERADVDCAAVEQARRDLTEATNAELDRLGVDRGDPRAFSIQVIVTSQHAAEYWSAMQEAVGAGEAELQQAAETVVGYWAPLDADLDGIELPDAGDAAITEATNQYLAISEQHPDEEVVPAQERLTAGVDAACGTGAG